MQLVEVCSHRNILLGPQPGLCSVINIGTSRRCLFYNIFLKNIIKIGRYFNLQRHSGIGKKCLHVGQGAVSAIRANVATHDNHDCGP